MSTTKSLPVASLDLDLANFRTVAQTDEDSAIRAMIAIKPEYFWPLLDSLLDDGYMPTENIIVLAESGPSTKLIVKEGNRRIAALKIALGLKNPADFSVSAELTAKINALSTEWKKENSKVPCAVYPSSESSKVERIVSLIHGKNEKAGRNHWQPVAKARHNRDIQKASEPGLDLLEKYLKEGRNISAMQRERWAGDFYITVLDEALKKLSKRVGATSSKDLVSLYPSGMPLYREGLEDIISAIGLKVIGFDEIRNPNVDFAAAYGIPVNSTPTGGTPASGSTPAIGTPASGTPTGSTPIGGSTPAGSTPTGAPPVGGTSAGGSVPTSGTPVSGGTPASGTPASSGTPAGGTSTAPPAFSTSDPRAVRQTLKAFTPRGINRQKVVALKDEAMRLDIKKTPLAFCFLVRSMLEISSKAYSEDHSSEPSMNPLKPGGNEKSLLEMLRAVHDHLVTDPTARGRKNTALVRKFHGAMTELGNPTSVLSITSMNSLVHHLSFSVSSDNACVAFGNIYPLMEAMN